VISINTYRGLAISIEKPALLLARRGFFYKYPFTDKVIDGFAPSLMLKEIQTYSLGFSVMPHPTITHLTIHGTARLIGSYSTAVWKRLKRGEFGHFIQAGYRAPILISLIEIERRHGQFSPADVEWAMSRRPGAPEGRPRKSHQTIAINGG
jgi:hypothetical protein